MELITILPRYEYDHCIKYGIIQHYEVGGVLLMLEVSLFRLLSEYNSVSTMQVQLCFD